MTVRVQVGETVGAKMVVGVARKGGCWRDRGRASSKTKNKKNKKRWYKIEILARVAVVTCTNYHKTTLFRATKFSQRKVKCTNHGVGGCWCCV